MLKHFSSFRSQTAESRLRICFAYSINVNENKWENKNIKCGNWNLQYVKLTTNRLTAHIVQKEKQINCTQCNISTGH